MRMLTHLFDWLSSVCGLATFDSAIESPDSLSDVKGKIYAGLARKLGGKNAFPLTSHTRNAIGWIVEGRSGCWKAVELTETKLKLVRRLMTHHECTSN